jgi:NAD(P)-dependent dehydrogenase (short-subunit alcohol dehydrogenase family)
MARLRSGIRHLPLSFRSWRYNAAVSLFSEIDGMTGVEGRVAMVTGAGRGIGRVTAEVLASRGARVMCVARTRKELEEVGLDFVVADLGTIDGCAHAVSRTRQRHGDVEILVCNHGIGSAHEKVVWEQRPEIWSETIAVNLDGPFYLSRLVLRPMIERGYGRIVYTSSTAGLVAEYGSCAYNSSKHGLIGLMRSVATDAGAFGVTANAVLPGWVRTEMAERSALQESKDRGISVGQVWQERAASYPPGRVATTQEVAETIAFLASEEASGVNGEAIKVALGSVA